VSKQQLEQAALFSLDDLQQVRELDECLTVSPSQAKYTGSTILKRRELVEAVCECLVLHWSERSIAERFKISRKSVPVIRLWAEANGKLAPYKERISKRLAGAFELGLDTWEEGVRDGRVKPDQIPVAMGIFFDKRQLVEGEATAIVETHATVSEASFREKFAQAAEMVSDKDTSLAIDAQVVATEDTKEQNT
jgi:hypothetical protein